MKKYLWTLFLLPWLLVACNDDEEPEVVELTIDENALTNQWRLIKYVDDGTDKTGDFPNNTIVELFSNKDVFLPGSQPLIFGSWSVEDNGKRLNITLQNGTDPYNELDEDWAVTKLDENNLWLLDADDLGDDDPADDSIEEFHFEKVTQ